MSTPSLDERFINAGTRPHHHDSHYQHDIDSQIDELFTKPEDRSLMKQLIDVDNINYEQFGLQGPNDTANFLNNTALGKKIMTVVGGIEAQEEILEQRQILENIQAQQQRDAFKRAILLGVALEIAAKKAEAAGVNAAISQSQLDILKEAVADTNESLVQPVLQSDMPSSEAVIEHTEAYNTSLAEYNQLQNEYVNNSNLSNYLDSRLAALDPTQDSGFAKDLTEGLEAQKPLLDKAQEVLSDEASKPEDYLKARLSLQQARDDIQQKMALFHKSPDELTEAEAKLLGDMQGDEYAALAAQSQSLQNMSLALLDESDLKDIHAGLDGASTKEELIAQMDSFVEKGYLSAEDAASHKDLLLNGNPKYAEENLADLKADLKELFKPYQLCDENGQALEKGAKQDEAYFVKPEGYQLVQAGDAVYMYKGDDSAAVESTLNDPELTASGRKLEVQDGKVYMLQKSQTLDSMTPEQKSAASDQAQDYMENQQKHGKAARQLAEQHMAPGKSIEMAHKALTKSRDACTKKAEALTTQMTAKKAEIQENKTKLDAAIATAVHTASQELGMTKHDVSEQLTTGAGLGKTPTPTLTPASISERLERLTEKTKNNEKVDKKDIAFIAGADMLSKGMMSRDQLARWQAEWEAGGGLESPIMNRGRTDQFDKILGDPNDTDIQNLSQQLDQTMQKLNDGGQLAQATKLHELTKAFPRPEPTASGSNRDDGPEVEQSYSPSSPFKIPKPGDTPKLERE